MVSKSCYIRLCNCKDYMKRLHSAVGAKAQPLSNDDRGEMIRMAWTPLSIITSLAPSRSRYVIVRGSRFRCHFRSRA